MSFPTQKSRLFRIRESINHPDWPALSRLIDAKTLLRWNIKIICELNYVPNRYIVLSIFFKYSLSWLFLRKIIISLNSRRDKTINSGIIIWQWGKLFICLLQCITCDISVQTAFPHALWSMSRYWPAGIIHANLYGQPVRVRD